MLRIDRRLLQNVDWLLLVTAFGLVVISTVTLSSLHVGRAGGTVVARQIIWFVIGLVVMVFVASLDSRRLVRAAPALYLLGPRRPGLRLRARAHRVGRAAVDRDGARSPCSRPSSSRYASCS